MKKSIILVAVAYFMLSATCDNSEKNANAQQTALTDKSTKEKRSSQQHKRYDEKSGKIVYKISGDFMNGEKTMWWDDYGLKQAEYENSSVGMAGITQSTKKHTITIINEQFQSEIYVCDPDKGTGTHMTNDFLSGERMEDTDWQHLGRTMMKQMGGKKVGEETIAGVTAEKWEIPNAYTFTWIWKHINVKNEVTMGMKVIEEAISIDTDISVPAIHFDYSKYKIKEMGTATDVMEMLNQGDY